MREREFTSLSIVTFAHGILSVIPLSALSLARLKSSNNNNCLKMSVQEQWGSQTSLLGCPLSAMAVGADLCPISSFQVPFMWLALGRNLQINAVCALILQSEKSMGGIIPPRVRHTQLLMCFYLERHSPFLMANPVLEPHPFSSMRRKAVLGDAYVPFRRKDSLDPVTWEYFSSSFPVCFLFLVLTLQVERLMVSWDQVMWEVCSGVHWPAELGREGMESAWGPRTRCEVWHGFPFLAKTLQNGPRAAKMAACLRW